MKKKSKFIKINTGLTKAQLEAGLDAELNSGWEFTGIYDIHGTLYAIFVKVVGSLR